MNTKAQEPAWWLFLKIIFVRQFLLVPWKRESARITKVWEEKRPKMLWGIFANQGVQTVDAARHFVIVKTSFGHARMKINAGFFVRAHVGAYCYIKVRRSRLNPDKLQVRLA
ncbi:MAG TPA: hypothetical protein VJH63_02585 [Candidatus Paceibacterota bacterium]